jgi:hypothetical protein
MEQLIVVRVILDEQRHAIQSPELPQGVAERYTQKAGNLRIGVPSGARTKA